MLAFITFSYARAFACLASKYGENHTWSQIVDCLLIVNVCCQIRLNCVSQPSSIIPLPVLRVLHISFFFFLIFPPLLFIFHTPDSAFLVFHFPFCNSFQVWSTRALYQMFFSICSVKKIFLVYLSTIVMVNLISDFDANTFIRPPITKWNVPWPSSLMLRVFGMQNWVIFYYPKESYQLSNVIISTCVNSSLPGKRWHSLSFLSWPHADKVTNMRVMKAGEWLDAVSANT